MKGLIYAAASAAAASVSAAGPPIVGLPMHRAAGVDVSEAYPTRAFEQGREGMARIRCTVGPAGQAKNCTTVGQAPLGFGFGVAAVSMSKFFIFDTTHEGQSTIGRTVVKEIKFSHPTKRDNMSPDEWLLAPWSRFPTKEEISAARPDTDEPFGMADVDCRTMAADGALSDCAIRSESPAGAGFGAAALKLADKVRPKDLGPPKLVVLFQIRWNKAREFMQGHELTPSVYVSSPSGDTERWPHFTVFQSWPTDGQLAAAKPADSTAPAIVEMTCDVRRTGAPDCTAKAVPQAVCKNVAYHTQTCTADATTGTDPRYEASAMALMKHISFFPSIYARLDQEPRATYHINWP